MEFQYCVATHPLWHPDMWMDSGKSRVRDVSYPVKINVMIAITPNEIINGLFNVIMNNYGN